VTQAKREGKKEGGREKGMAMRWSEGRGKEKRGPASAGGARKEGEEEQWGREGGGGGTTGCACSYPEKKGDPL